MKTEPTELSKKEPVLAVNHMVDWTNQERDITTDICYKWLKIAFREGQSIPKIKQLEWVKNGFDLISETLFGRYTISKPALGIAFILYINNNVKEAFFNLDEAKAAAQEDFEMRVKECLIIERNKIK